MSQEDQERIVDEAERRSQQLKALQEAAAAIVATILTASLLRIMPGLKRAYRRYQEALRPPEVGPDGQRYRPVAGTGVQASKRFQAVTQAAIDFVNAAELRRMERELEKVLRQAAAHGIESAQTLNAIQKITEGGQVPIPDDLIQAKVGALSGVIQARASEFRNVISQVVSDSAAQGFPGKRVERLVIQAFQGEQQADGTVLSRGLLQRVALEVETEVSVQALNATLRQTLVTGENYVRWVTAQDEKVCPYCASRHGRIYLASRITLPCHYRCRCMAAVVPDDQVNLSDPEQRHDVLDAPFWQEEERRTVLAYARAHGLEEDAARRKLAQYLKKPTQAEKARYPGVDEAVPPSYEPPPYDPRTTRL